MRRNTGDCEKEGALTSRCRNYLEMRSEKEHEKIRKNSIFLRSTKE